MLEFFYLINENNAYYYLIILSTGVYFESITKVLVNHIKLSNKFKSVGKIAFVTAIINIFLNLLLIPLIGIYGAVITSFLTYFIRFLWFYLTYIDVFNISSSFFAWSPKKIYIFNMIKMKNKTLVRITTKPLTLEKLLEGQLSYINNYLKVSQYRPTKTD